MTEPNLEKMVEHLRAAVELGFSFATPGTYLAVRNAFPDFFATDKEVERMKEYHDLDDDLELDDAPLVSRADNGFWVSCWAWSSLKEDSDDDEGTTTEESAPASV